MLSCAAMGAVSKPTEPIEMVVISVAHDAVKFGHRRDLRTLRLFIMGAVWGKKNVQVAAFGALGGGEVYAHVSEWEGQIQPGHIYLAAHNGHMRWDRATQYTPPTVWRYWGGILYNPSCHYSYHLEEMLDDNADFWDGFPHLHASK